MSAHNGEIQPAKAGKQIAFHSNSTIPMTDQSETDTTTKTENGSSPSSAGMESCAARVEVFAKYRVLKYAHDRHRPLCDLPYAYATVEVPADRVNEVTVAHAIVDSEESNVESIREVEVERYDVED